MATEPLEKQNTNRKTVFRKNRKKQITTWKLSLFATPLQIKKKKETKHQ